MATGTFGEGKLMKLVFLLEESSMKVMLDIILPKILPDNVDFITIAHSGKSDLKKSIPIKLRGWNEPDVKFVIVHDQDSNDCKKLKEELQELCDGYSRRVLIRIPCRELEAWYFGDLKAVSEAFSINLVKLQNKKKYRIPDNIQNAKKEIQKLLPAYGQRDGARKIAKHMDIDNNTSHSFKVFVDGIRLLCSEDL